MALVISDDVEGEANRIIASKNAFDVLELNPSECSREIVLSQYEKKVSMFKRLFRNKSAMQAKAKLDDAKMRLLDERLRVKEVTQFNEVQRNRMRDREDLSALEARTKMLEMRAEALQTRKIVSSS